MYRLVKWPFSQQFIGCEDAHLAPYELGDSAYFVEYDLYKFGQEHPDLYSEELQKEYEKNGN